MEEFFSIFTDGGARGNPGPAAIGFVVKDGTGKIINETGRYIGRTTNNVAEYTAVIAALEWLNNQLTIKQSNNITIKFYLDSQLVVNQLNGLFKIKDEKLRTLIINVRILEGDPAKKITYSLIPRCENQAADRLVNQVLDQKHKTFHVKVQEK